MHIVNFDATEFTLEEHHLEGSRIDIFGGSSLLGLHVNGVFIKFSGEFARDDHTTFSFKDGFVHSYNENPAINKYDLIKWWFNEGMPHRKDGPCLVSGNVLKFALNGNYYSFNGYLSRIS